MTCGSASLQFISLKPGILLLTRRLKASALHATMMGNNGIKMYLSTVFSSVPAVLKRAH